MFATTSAKLAGVIVAGAVVVGVSATVFAGTGSAGVPGGFTSVVVTKTVPTSGGTLTGTLNGHQISVTVPSGALTQPVVVAVTWGSPAEIGNAGINGDSAIVAVGLSATNPASGNPVTGYFGQPVTVTITGSFSSADPIVSYSVANARWSTLSGATVTAGKVTFSTTSGMDFAVMAASSSAGAKTVAVTPSTAAPVTQATTAPATTPAVPAATAGTTDVSTGEPFLLEGIIAGVLVLTGVSSLIILMTRNRRSAW
jgi:hypothetical protein